jgi:hypothetical protein
MNLRTMMSPRARTRNGSDGTTAGEAGAHRRPPAGARRPALYLSTAVAGALLVNVLASGEPAAHAEETPLESVSIAEQLGISADPADAAPAGEDAVRPLSQLAASRAERDAERTAAAQAQAAADQAELDRRAAEEAAAQAAAEQAAAEAAAREAEAQAAAGQPAPVAPAGSYQDYAMGKLGGSGSEFSCLENLWGKESGWNPNAQNPTSTAYGIAQFLDSTWAGTGIAKTSDGYRQIDAGLIYIESRYGSPCSAWAHSQANNWY